MAHHPIARGADVAEIIVRVPRCADDDRTANGGLAPRQERRVRPLFCLASLRWTLRCLEVQQVITEHQVTAAAFDRAASTIGSNRWVKPARERLAMWCEAPLRRAPLQAAVLCANRQHIDECLVPHIFIHGRAERD